MDRHEAIRNRDAFFSDRQKFPQNQPSRSGRWGRIVDELVKWIKYQVVGLGNTAVSMSVLNLFFLLCPPTTRIILLVGNTSAYIAGDMNSFFWNVRWTFRAGKGNFRQAARFGLLCLTGLSINAAILWSASGWLLSLDVPKWLVGNLSQLSMAVTGIIGYIVCRLWVFRDSRPKDLAGTNPPGTAGESALHQPVSDNRPGLAVLSPSRKLVPQNISEVFRFSLQQNETNQATYENQ